MSGHCDIIKISCASCRDGMVLIVATTADTDCTYYFAPASAGCRQRKS